MKLKASLHFMLCLIYSCSIHSTANIFQPFIRDYLVSRYQKNLSPTHTYPDHQSFFICFLHLPQSIASSLFNLCAWQSFCTTSLQVIFGLEPPTSYSIGLHFFFTQSLSFFDNTCLYHHNLFCCRTFKQKIKSIKIRVFFLEDKIRFIRSEQLWPQVPYFHH